MLALAAAAAPCARVAGCPAGCPNGQHQDPDSYHVSDDSNVLISPIDETRQSIRSVAPGPADDASLSHESAAFASARANLPPRFILHDSARFVVLSDSDLNWTRSQVEHLERAYHQFHRFARRLDLRPRPLRHKLVCVLFENRDDYQRFARQHDGVKANSIAGYYSPRNDRIVFYNPQSNPSVGRANEKLRNMNDEIRSLRASIAEAWHRGEFDRAYSLRLTLARYRHHVESQSARVSTFIEQTGVATTIHEAIHQLLFHTRVQSPYVQYPLWISEGIATSFETDRPAEAFGPDREYQPRREKFEELLAQDRLLPLETLLTLTVIESDSDENLAQVVYHQSYALVPWMARFRRTELARFLDLMRREDSGRPTAERYLKIFTAAFGDIDRLERIWLRHERARAGSIDTD